MTLPIAQNLVSSNPVSSNTELATIQTVDHHQVSLYVERASSSVFLAASSYKTCGKPSGKISDEGDPSAVEKHSQLSASVRDCFGRLLGESLPVYVERGKFLERVLSAKEKGGAKFCVQYYPRYRRGTEDHASFVYVGSYGLRGGGLCGSKAMSVEQITEKSEEKRAFEGVIASPHVEKGAKGRTKGEGKTPPMTLALALSPMNTPHKPSRGKPSGGKPSGGKPSGGRPVRGQTLEGEVSEFEGSVDPRIEVTGEFSRELKKLQDAMRVSGGAEALMTIRALSVLDFCSVKNIRTYYKNLWGLIENQDLFFSIDREGKHGVKAELIRLFGQLAFEHYRRSHESGMDIEWGRLGGSSSVFSGHINRAKKWEEEGKGRSSTALLFQLQYARSLLSLLPNPATWRESFDFEEDLIEKFSDRPFVMIFSLHRLYLATLARGVTGEGNTSQFVDYLGKFMEKSRSPSFQMPWQVHHFVVGLLTKLAPTCPEVISRKGGEKTSYGLIDFLDFSGNDFPWGEDDDWRVREGALKGLMILWDGAGLMAKREIQVACKSRKMLESHIAVRERLDERKGWEICLEPLEPSELLMQQGNRGDRKKSTSHLAAKWIAKRGRSLIKKLVVLHKKNKRSARREENQREKALERGIIDYLEGVMQRINELHDPEITKVCHVIRGDMAQVLGDYSTALREYTFDCERKTADYGENSLEVAKTLNAIAGVHERAKEYPKALEHYQKALAIRWEHLGRNHTDVADVHHNIGWIYQATKQGEKALEHYQKALDARTEVLSPNHIDIANTHDRMGAAYYALRQYTRALEHYESALKIKKTLLGDDHSDLGVLYRNMGSVCQRCPSTSDTSMLGTGRSHNREKTKALEYYEKALQIWSKEKGARDLNIADVHSNMGGVYYRQQEYPKALEHHSIALDIRLKKLGMRDVLVARTCYNVGLVRAAQKEYTKALECYQNALPTQIERWGAKHLHVANIYHNMGRAYHEIGNQVEALRHYQEALNIRLEELGEDHPKVVDTCDGMGDTYRAKGQYEEALEYYQKVLNVRLENLPPAHIDLAAAYRNLGVMYHAQGEDKHALEHYDKALHIYRQDNTLEEESRALELARTYGHMARAYCAQGRHNKVLDFFHKALNIQLDDVGFEGMQNDTDYDGGGQQEKAFQAYLETLRPESSHLRMMCRQMGNIYKKQGNGEKAREYFQKVEILQQQGGLKGVPSDERAVEGPFIDKV